MALPFFYFFSTFPTTGHLYNIRLKGRHFFHLGNTHKEEQYFYERDRIEYLIIWQFVLNTFNHEFVFFP